jgi:four helix bundle protein
MNAEELQERTMLFAVRVLRFSGALPKNTTGRTIAQQVARSGTSVAANYRAARRCKSRGDFVNKITIVLEEADETEFWIELAQRMELLPQAKLAPLRDEASQLTRIFNATRTTARNRES